MPSQAPLLRMEGIGKSFPGVRALDGVTFEVFSGEVHALMGENGAGKSTLMKILAGAYQCDEGAIWVDGGKVVIDGPATAKAFGIQIIYQEFNLVHQLSVAENIFLGAEQHYGAGFVDFRRMKAEAQQIMDDLGASLDVGTPVSRLSVALQQMVEIAKATSRRSRILVMDEPSATLTERELENLYRLIEKLRSEGVAIIYISHRMDEVFKICDRITVLRDGKSVATVAKEEVTPDELVRLMVGRTLEDNFPKEVACVGEVILEVGNLSVGFVRDINLEVRAGEVVALAGLVGSGRTEVARCIFGADQPDRGRIVLDGKPLVAHGPQDAISAGIGFVTEDRKGQGLVLELSVRENSTLAALNSLSRYGFIDRGAERSRVAEYISNLGIRTPSAEQRAKNLSGGNQQKVVLAKWLLTGSKLLILDEPTRGIDVGAKVEIYRLMNELTKQGIGILMISSELPEVIGMADRILIMREGALVGELSREEATQEKIGQLAIGVPAIVK